MAIEVRPATAFDDVATVLVPKLPDANVCWCLSVPSDLFAGEPRPGGAGAG